MRSVRNLLLVLSLASGTARAQDTVAEWEQELVLPAGHTIVDVSTSEGSLAVVDLAGKLLVEAGSSFDVLEGVPGVRTRWRSSPRGGTLAHVTLPFVEEQPRTQLGFGADLLVQPAIDLPRIWEFLLDEVGGTVVALRRLGPFGRYELLALDPTGAVRAVPGLAALQSEKVLGFCLSEDGRRLAVAVSGAAHVFGLDGGGALYSLPGRGNWQLSADGRFAAVLGPRLVRLYDRNVQIASVVPVTAPRGVAFTEGAVAVVEASAIHVFELPGGAARTLAPALAAGERLGSVDLRATPSGLLIALGVLSAEPSGGKARLELRRPDGSTTRWPGFDADDVEVRSPRVRFSPHGDRLLAWTRTRLQTALVP